MAASTTGGWRRLFGRPAVDPTPDQPAPVDVVPVTPAVDIAVDDPLLAHLRDARGAVDLDDLALDSPALRSMREAGVRLAVPLLSQGDLIGVLNLGARRSDQDYTAEDLRLLDGLAAQAAPALRVGQLVREQQAEAVTRQRFEHELEVARLIQQNFLPQQLPDLAGWHVAAYYRPAREVGGDFYDVIPLLDGRIGFVIGDVTDKGVPAALVMAATRSVLRAEAHRVSDPGEVLRQVNEQLCPDMPAKMFVTCLYGVLDPRSGRFRFANAGHDLPYVRTEDGSKELRARGMPLGLMPGMAYEEQEAVLEAGDTLLLHSDGIVEAHSAEGEMFGFPRLKEAVGRYSADELIQRVLDEMRAHTGPDAEQEDDITMVMLARSPASALGVRSATQHVEFEVPSQEGNERLASERVRAVVGPLLDDPARLRRLETAVAEATMNAMEHGNHYRADQPVVVRVLTEADQVRVQVVDQGVPAPDRHAETPDLEAKISGLQRPRGWGLFLIQHMVDEVHETTDGDDHVLELVVHLEQDDPTAEEARADGAR